MLLLEPVPFHVHLQPKKFFLFYKKNQLNCLKLLLVKMHQCAAEFTVCYHCGYISNCLIILALALATVTNCRFGFHARLNITPKCLVHHKHQPARGLGMPLWVKCMILCGVTASINLVLFLMYGKLYAAVVAIYVKSLKYTLEWYIPWLIFFLSESNILMIMECSLGSRDQNIWHI